MRIQLLVVVPAALIAGLVACGGDDTPRPPAGPSPPAVFTSISLTGPAEVAPGNTAQFTLTAAYSDNSTTDVTSSASWSAQGLAPLRSLGSGRYEAVAAGEGRVLASYNGRSASKPVMVLPPGTFKLSGSITALTALDFLGLGLPPGSPSLGELLAQGKANLQAPWLGIAAFVSIAGLLSLLIFIGEGVRDALDPRKTFR